MAGIESAATGNKKDRTKKPDLLSSFQLCLDQRRYFIRSNIRQSLGVTTNFVLLSWKLSQIYFFKGNYFMRFKLGRLLSIIKSRELKFHTGQYGEDVFLHKQFRRMLNKGFYIDVGAHHPYAISNTSYLWSLGWNGVNVDASKAAILEFNSARPDDLNICAAVVSADKAQPGSSIRFYFNKDIDNTATCDVTIAEERGLLNSVDVPCVSMSSLISQAKANFGGNFDFLNIDIEGFDEVAILDINSWPEKPKILMIEIYSRDLVELLARPSVNTLMSAGYLLVQRMGHTAVFTRTEGNA